MNGYVAFWRGKRVELHAATIYQAQQIAAELLKAKGKSYEVTVVLAEKNGEPVVHSTASI